MTTPTSRNTRTLTGYVESLLEYPRWVIERDVDFTHCQFQGNFSSGAETCDSCQFGRACCWLSLNRDQTQQEGLPPDDPLPDLLDALSIAADYLRQTHVESHRRGCTCKTCVWLQQAHQFLHSQRHH
jgi:hypothetical protein